MGITKVMRQGARAVLEEEGLEGLYNPHAATGLSCGCLDCAYCAAMQVFNAATSDRQKFLASQGEFKDIEEISLVGRLWVDGSNTYHRVKIVRHYADGTSSDTLVKTTYGYERQYEDTAYEYLFVDAFNERKHLSLPRLCTMMGIEFTSKRVDIKNEEEASA